MEDQELDVCSMCPGCLRLSNHPLTPSLKKGWGNKKVPWPMARGLFVLYLPRNEILLQTTFHPDYSSIYNDGFA